MTTEICEYTKVMLALVMWREDRRSDINGNLEGLRAVAHVVANRAHDCIENFVFVITQHDQFSSITYPKDPQLARFPTISDKVFQDCLMVASLVINGTDHDLTNGATHYFNPSIVIPDWAATMTKVASFGGHDFYK